MAMSTESIFLSGSFCLVRLALSALIAAAPTHGQGRISQAQQAANALSEVSKLVVGQSSYSETKVIGEKIGATPSAECSAEKCSWILRIQSMSNHTSNEKSASTFSVSLSVKGSTLVAKSFAFQVGDGIDVPFVWVREQPQLSPSARENPQISWQSSNVTPYYRIYVRMTPDTDPLIRERYENFNLSCLSSPNECKNAKALLPTIEWPKQ